MWLSSILTGNQDHPLCDVGGLSVVLLGLGDNAVGRCADTDGEGSGFEAVYGVQGGLRAVFAAEVNPSFGQLV